MIIPLTMRYNITRFDVITSDTVISVPQHFLLSAKARTLSLAKVMRMSDAEAFEAFKQIRWAKTQGNPFCPRCGCVEIYSFKTRKIFKCRGCGAQFSVTTGTIFASRKLSLRDILAAIAIFVNGAKGHSMLQLSRDLDVQYKTAFVLSHKIREALSNQKKGEKLSGEVEVDGAYFGGYIKPANMKAHRLDRRLKYVHNGKREVVVAMRQRGGDTVTNVFKAEHDSVKTIEQRVVNGSTIYADDATGWDALHARYLTKRINHSEAYSKDGACTNQAESFFSRIRRAEIGMHHHIAGKYLESYANEMAWREDNRRRSNGEQYLKVANAALGSPVSRQWKGYWQHKKR